MQRKQLQKQVKRLTEEKKKLEKVEAGLIKRGLDEPLRDAFTELSTVDNHPADSGSQLYERSKDLGLLDATRQQLGDIEQALSAIREGSYGICRRCGRPISEARLAAMPSALLCITCKRIGEERDFDNRPIEEEFLYPPFGRTFLDEEDSVVFDGEDAWEAVERYGTSFGTVTRRRNSFTKQGNPS